METTATQPEVDASQTLEFEILKIYPRSGEVAAFSACEVKARMIGLLIQRDGSRTPEGSMALQLGAFREAFGFKNSESFDALVVRNAALIQPWILNSKELCKHRDEVGEYPLRPLKREVARRDACQYVLPQGLLLLASRCGNKERIEIVQFLVNEILPLGNDILAEQFTSTQSAPESHIDQQIKELKASTASTSKKIDELFKAFMEGGARSAESSLENESMTCTEAAIEFGIMTDEREANSPAIEALIASEDFVNRKLAIYEDESRLLITPAGVIELWQVLKELNLVRDETCSRRILGAVHLIHWQPNGSPY